MAARAMIDKTHRKDENLSPMLERRAAPTKKDGLKTAGEEIALPPAPDEHNWNSGVSSLVADDHCAEVDARTILHPAYALSMTANAALARSGEGRGGFATERSGFGPTAPQSPTERAQGAQALPGDAGASGSGWLCTSF